MRKLSNEEILGLLDEGYSMNDIEKGYGEYHCSGSTTIIENALIIEKIGVIDKLDDDWEACRCAEKDGVKFINNIEQLEKGCYIDTPENRKLCIEYLNKSKDYWIETLKNKYSEAEGWERYDSYCFDLFKNELLLAIEKHKAESIDIIYEEATKTFYGVYHSKTNSFRVTENYSICCCNTEIIVKLCDQLGIGYVL